MENIELAVEIIKNGGVIICPTDTVYGLICDATNKKAVAKVFKIKKRPKNKPLPIFIKDLKMAKELAQIDEKQEKFLRKVWPGAVTVILKSRKQKDKTIGLRIPNYKLLLGLAEQLNRPLTGTSANLSGQPASGNIKKVLKQFENQKYQPDLVIDAGNLPKSKPSKIIDLTVCPPKILRP
ncbi:MAG: L-threonylcarbamoyladenylate synthase [Patescibacteria group bacterium]